MLRAKKKSATVRLSRFKFQFSLRFSNVNQQETPSTQKKIYKSIKIINTLCEEFRPLNIKNSNCIAKESLNIKL